MMSLQMQVIFGLGVFQVPILAWLMLPLPHFLRRLIYHFCTSRLYSAILHYFFYLMVFVFVFFVDSVRHMLSRQQLYDDFKGHIKQGKTNSFDGLDQRKFELLEQMFWAQRNFYLTGFVLFCSFGIHVFMMKQKRIVELENDVVELERDLKLYADDNKKDK